MVWRFGCLRGGERHRTETALPAKTTPSFNNIDQETEQCWICLENGAQQRLHQPCGCPRYVHHKCLARWQLQSAGKDEECRCRFCSKVLPDWKQFMTPPNVTPCRTAVMAVVLNNREHRIIVEPGPNGRRHFEREIRRLFGLSHDDELEFTFDCQAPSEDLAESLQLEGKGAFEAAFHCAAVTAALRAQQKGRT